MVGEFKKYFNLHINNILNILTKMQSIDFSSV